jgi:hypothetical protein
MVTKQKGEEILKRLMPEHQIEWDTWQKGIPASVQGSEVKVAASILPMLSEAEFVALVGHEAAHVKAMDDPHFAKLKTREEMAFEAGHEGTLFNIFLIGIYNRYHVTENVSRSLHKKVAAWRAAGN